MNTRLAAARLALLKEALAPQVQQETPATDPTGFEQQAQISGYTPIPIPQQGISIKSEPAGGLLPDLDLAGVGEMALPGTVSTDAVGDEYSTPGPSGAFGGGKMKRAQMGEMLTDPQQPAGGGAPLTTTNSRRRIRPVARASKVASVRGTLSLLERATMQIPQDVMGQIESKVATKLAADLPKREGSSMMASGKFSARKIGMLLKQGQTPPPLPATPPPPKTTAGGGGSALGSMMNASMSGGRAAQGRPVIPPGGGHGTTKVSQEMLARVQERAFQEQKAKYAQAGPLHGPMARLQEVRDRDVGWLPAGAGIGAGWYGGREAAQALEERGIAETIRRKGKKPFYMTDRLRGRDVARKGLGALGGAYMHAASPLQGRRRGAATRARVSKQLQTLRASRGPLRLRGLARMGLRAGLPVAGLWAAKGLFGRERSPAERMYGHGTSKVAAGDFFAEHPMATALGGAALGGLAPWAIKGLADRAGYEFDPSVFSGLGAAAGGLGGYIAAKRSQSRRIREERAKEQKRQQRAMMMAMQAQGSPFGG